MSAKSCVPTVWSTDYSYLKAASYCRENHSVAASIDSAGSAEDKRVVVFRSEELSNGHFKTTMSLPMTMAKYEASKSETGVTAEFHQNNPLVGLEKKLGT